MDIWRPKGIIAVDKQGDAILFLDPVSLRSATGRSSNMDLSSPSESGRILCRTRKHACRYETIRKRLRKIP
jgi:hypothetical protein